MKADTPTKEIDTPMLLDRSPNKFPEFGNVTSAPFHEGVQRFSNLIIFHLVRVRYDREKIWKNRNHPG